MAFFGSEDSRSYFKTPIFMGSGLFVDDSSEVLSLRGRVARTGVKKVTVEVACGGRLWGRYGYRGREKVGRIFLVRTLAA